MVDRRVTSIAGLISTLRTMADRHDVRPVIMFYANREWDGVAFREQLEELKDGLDLTLVHVLERPPDGWDGESGYESALVELDVPAERVHTERFDMA